MIAALTLVAPLLAQTTKKTTSGNPILLIFIVIAAAFYFLIYRPQQRKAKALREQGNTFDVGDEVLTAGGIVGYVIDIDGDRVTLETSVGASFVVLRQYVLRKIEPPVDHEQVEADEADDEQGALPAADGHEAADDHEEDDEVDGQADDSTGDDHADHVEDGADAEADATPDAAPGVTGRSARRRRKSTGTTGADEGDGSDEAGAADGPPIN